MKFEHDGLQLWYGTPDAPAPDQSIEADTTIPITVAAFPADPSNHVEVIYRINRGSTRRQTTTWWRNDSSGTQYFTARLGPFRPRDLVEYGAICHCAGRQVPSIKEATKLPSLFHVTNGETPSQTPAPRTVVRAPAAVGSPNLAPPSPQIGQGGPCPQPPPPPRVCNRVVCRYPQGWGYQPLAAGTPCQGTGVCDRGGSCVMPQPTQLAITSDQVNSDLSLLGGSELWIDASGNSPPLITGYHSECSNDPPGPIPPFCWQVADVAHSYIRFSDIAKTYLPLNDYALPHRGPYCGFAGVCLTVNQISGDLGKARVSFGEWSSGGSYARLSMPLHSPSSTVIIDSGMPDVQLTNMQVSVDISLIPTVDQSGNAAVAGYVDRAVFDFDANLNNFPDWLVGLFYDLSDDIETRVRDGIRAAFADQDRQNALTSALNSAILRYAKKNVPGFTGFASIIYISVSGDGTLLIHYVPK
jgi:hypothetical protein